MKYKEYGEKILKEYEQVFALQDEWSLPVLQVSTMKR